MASEKKIIQEISERATDYEQNMSGFLAECGEYGDLFRVRPPKRTDNTFSNPRQTEFYRAASAIATLSYRMMTAADPYFSIKAVGGNPDYDALDTVMHVISTQLRYAKYRQNLLRACHYAPVYGTVICQEDYRVIGVSPFGRQLPVTVMTPRVLDQVMFDRGTINIDQADWLSTADITSSVELMRLAQEAKDIKAPWNPKALEAASKDKEEKNTINWQVLERIRRSGFTQDEAMSKKKELLMFYGKLDCMNDGIEYIAALVNRKYLVRFHANNLQSGRRPFRVAKWVDFHGALGDGLGSLLSAQHRAMDSNRQKAQDLFSFGAYNMWKRRKNTIANEDLDIGPLNVVDVDNMDDLMPLTPNLGAADGISRLDEVLKQEFRAASGASDSLQGIVSDATATSNSLAQNEAIRSISVHSEQLAEPLVREHIEDVHWNNVQNIRAPLNINRAGISQTVYPSQLRMDLEIEAKTTTDKDFSPKRLEKLINLIQILTSTKSQHPDQLSISILPLVKEVSHLLEVNPSEVIMRPGMMPTAPQMGAAEMLGMGGAMVPGMGGVGVANTPVGPVMAS